MVRLLPVVDLLPLVETVREDQTSTRFEGLAEGRLLRDRFAAGVNHPAAYLGVLGPGRDQTPPEQL